MPDLEKQLTAENLKLRGEIIALKRAFLNQQNMLNAMQTHAIEQEASQLTAEIEVHNAKADNTGGKLG